jgi:Concanavalin A-like lectin/glucanases superfamily
MLEAAAEILWDSTKNKDNQKTFIFNEHVNRQYVRNIISRLELEVWLAMKEKRHRFEKINKVFLPAISRPLVIFGICLLFIQFIWISALAESVKHYDGYNVISYDDGSKDIISGGLNFLQWDGKWKPKDELNISNGSWPYLVSENETTANFRVDDSTLSLPKENTTFKLRENSISYVLNYSKSDLKRKQTSINLTDAFIDLQYSLKSDKPKNKYKDKYKIRYDRFEFNAGEEHISVYDDTLRNYSEGGEVFQDVTYLSPGVDYDYGIDNNGQIQFKFKKNALNKLTGNVSIEIRTWDIIGPKNWGGNVTFSQATDVKATGNAELEQTVSDYVLYTRFDEDDGTTIYEGNRSTIYNENISNVPLGELYLDDAYTNPYTTGKYGQAIHFDGKKNKVVFNDHPAIRLGYDFTISLYLKLAPGIDNNDSDITRKGSTATVEPDSWWKVEIKKNIIWGVVTKDRLPSPEQPEKDTQERRDGLWHFVAYTREGNTCSLFVDNTASPVASRDNCSTNTSNTGLLAIGSKDTEDSSTGKDYTNGTIDEVRFFDRTLSASNLTSIQNNEHYPAGTLTRNLSSLIYAGEELKEAGCNGTWDRSTTKVDILVSTDNNTWDTIQSNATPNAIYTINPGNNYTYLRCSLSTIDSSKTPIVQSMRAKIGQIGSKLMAFARGTDNALWFRKYDGTAWGAWQSLGGMITSDPDAVSSAPNKVDVVVQGTDNATWIRRYDGAAWSAWQSLGGNFNSGPGIASSNTNLLEVFARGSDNALWVKRYDGAAWGSWQSLGGILSSDPDASNRLDIVVRGTDNGLWIKRYSGGTWGAWQSLGGTINSGPTAASSGASNLDVFARGADNALWQRSWNGASWGAWQSLGGVISSDSDATSAGSGIDIVTRGADNALWQKTWNGASWGAWGSLGGIINSGPTIASWT